MPTFAAAPLFGGHDAMVSGRTTFTGTASDIDTDLALLAGCTTAVMATTQASGEALSITYNHGADGLLDLYAWDDTGAAATVECVVSWLVWGTK